MELYWLVESLQMAVRLWTAPPSKVSQQSETTSLIVRLEVVDTWLICPLASLILQIHTAVLWSATRRTTCEEMIALSIRLLRRLQQPRWDWHSNIHKIHIRCNVAIQIDPTLSPNIEMFIRQQCNYFKLSVKCRTMKDFEPIRIFGEIHWNFIFQPEEDGSQTTRSRSRRS